MSDDRAALIAKARGLGGLSSTVQAVVNEIADALEVSVQAPAVDREALAKALWRGGNKTLPHDWWEEATGIAKAPYYAKADHLLASGVLQDAAEVEANALEVFAYSCDDGWGEFAYMDKAGMIGYASVPEMLRERAQQVREGKA